MTQIKNTLLVLATIAILFATAACEKAEKHDVVPPNPDKVPCETSDQCSGGQVCSGGYCVDYKSTCTASYECSDGKICLNGECKTVSGCSGDTDCASGQTCNNGVCVDDADECTDDNECTDGKICDAGACIDDDDNACTSNSDCASGTVCSNGACVTEIKTSINANSSVTIKCSETISAEKPKKVATFTCKSGTCTEPFFDPALPAGLIQAVDAAKNTINISGVITDFAACAKLAENTDGVETKVTTCDGILQSECASDTFKFKTEVEPVRVKTSNSDLEDAPFGTAISAFTLKAEGGSGNYSWKDVGAVELCKDSSGNPYSECDTTLKRLPQGLVLNADGTITGTPTMVGKYYTVVKVTDNVTLAEAISEKLEMTVLDDGDFSIKLVRYNTTADPPTEETISASSNGKYNKTINIPFGYSLKVKIAGNPGTNFKLSTDHDNIYTTTTFIHPKTGITEAEDVTIKVTGNTGASKSITIDKITFELDPCPPAEFTIEPDKSDSKLFVLKKNGEIVDDDDENLGFTYKWFASSEKIVKIDKKKPQDCKVTPIDWYCSEQVGGGNKCKLDSKQPKFGACKDILGMDPEEDHNIETSFNLKAVIEYDNSSCGKATAHLKDIKADYKIESYKKEMIRKVFVMLDLYWVNEDCGMWTELYINNGKDEIHTKYASFDDGDEHSRFKYFSEPYKLDLDDSDKTAIDEKNIPAGNLMDFAIVLDDDDYAWFDMKASVQTVIIATDHYYLPFLTDGDMDIQVDGDWEHEHLWEEGYMGKWKVRCSPKAETQLGCGESNDEGAVDHDAPSGGK